MERGMERRAGRGLIWRERRAREERGGDGGRDDLGH
jgi:hypothetical protein